MYHVCGCLVPSGSIKNCASVNGKQPWVTSFCHLSVHYILQ
jgi:hypothetical protein